MLKHFKFHAGKDRIEIGWGWLILVMAITTLLKCS